MRQLPTASFIVSAYKPQIWHCITDEAHNDEKEGNSYGTRFKPTGAYLNDSCDHKAITLPPGLCITQLANQGGVTCICCRQYRVKLCMSLCIIFIFSLWSLV